MPVCRIFKCNTKKESHFLQLSDFQCGVTGNRTRDTRIFSPLLYQLSYDTDFNELPSLFVWDCKDSQHFFACKFFLTFFAKII